MSRARMRRSSAVVSIAVTAVAAVVGNAAVGKDALTWFRSLTAPRWQLPLPAFFAVAAVYYAVLAYVLARGVDRRDGSSIAWAVAVLTATAGTTPSGSS